MRNKVVPELWDKYVTSENWDDKVDRLRKRWRRLNQEDIDYINGDYYRLFTVLHRKYGLFVDEAKLEILEWLERGVSQPVAAHRQAEGASDHMHGVAPFVLLVRNTAAGSGVTGEEERIRSFTRSKDEQEEEPKSNRKAKGRKRINENTKATSGNEGFASNNEQKDESEQKDEAIA